MESKLQQKGRANQVNKTDADASYPSFISLQKTEYDIFSYITHFIDKDLTFTYDEDRLLHTSKLTLYNVTRSSSGTYKCCVRCQKGSFSKSINLKIVSNEEGRSIANLVNRHLRYTYLRIYYYVFIN